MSKVSAKNLLQRNLMLHPLVLGRVLRRESIREVINNNDINNNNNNNDYDDDDDDDDNSSFISCHMHGICRTISYFEGQLKVRVLLLASFFYKKFYHLPLVFSF